MPAVRWFFRQRADRVIELPSFKLPRRSALILRLTHDPELLGAAENYVRENGLPVAVAMSRVERYARGIVPSFNAFLYFRVGMPLAAWICNSIYDVRVDQEPAVHILDEEATVVFVMNHRSNLDYVLLAHLMARRTAIGFAAGEWADARPLGPLIRGMGAILVRRGSGDDLCRSLPACAGALRPDGRRGQTHAGRLPRGWAKPRRETTRAEDRAARLHAQAFRPRSQRHPLRARQRQLRLGARGSQPPPAWRSTSRNQGSRRLLRLHCGLGDQEPRQGATQRSFRLGLAAVGFGTPTSAREYAASRGISFSELGREGRIEEVGRLAARALIEAPEQKVPGDALISRARNLAQGEPLDCEAALRTLAIRRLISAERRGYRTAPGSEKIPAYYANSAYC